MGGQTTGAGGLLRFAQKLPFYLLSPLKGSANHTYHCSQFQNVLYRVEFTYFMVVSVILCETYLQVLEVCCSVPQTNKFKIMHVHCEG
jgi:hypothetical protein